MHLRIFALMKSRLFRKSKHFFRGFSIRFFFGTSFFQPSRCVPQNKMAQLRREEKKCVNNSIRARQRKILRKNSHPERALHRLVLLSDNFHEKIRIERKKSAHFTRGERKVAALCLAVFFFLPLSSSTGDERRGRLAHSLCMSKKYCEK